MEILRRKGEQQLKAQQGSLPDAQVTEMSLALCHVPLERFAAYPSLQSLHLVAMKPAIKDLTAFPSAAVGASLRHLNLSDNGVAAIPEGFGPLPALRKLSLANNPIDAEGPALDTLFATLARACPNLVSLELSDSPVSTDSQYRAAAFRHLPNLVTLDGCGEDGAAVHEPDSDEDTSGSDEGESNDSGSDDEFIVSDKEAGEGDGDDSDDEAESEDDGSDEGDQAEGGEPPCKHLRSE